MVQYYICQICGLKNKGTKPACDCLEKAQRELVAKSIGATIKDSFIWDGDDSGRYLTQKLSRGGERFFISVNLDPPRGSSTIFSITKQEYKKRKKAQDTPGSHDIVVRKSSDDSGSSGLGEEE
jgi:hypothetical protein